MISAANISRLETHQWFVVCALFFFVIFFQFCMKWCPDKWCIWEKSCYQVEKPSLSDICIDISLKPSWSESFAIVYTFPTQCLLQSYLIRRHYAWISNNKSKKKKENPSDGVKGVLFTFHQFQNSFISCLLRLGRHSLAVISIHLGAIIHLSGNKL